VLVGRVCCLVTPPLLWSWGPPLLGRGFLRSPPAGDWSRVLLCAPGGFFPEWDRLASLAHVSLGCRSIGWWVWGRVRDPGVGGLLSVRSALDRVRYLVVSRLVCPLLVVLDSAPTG
jgi:hypothetical protein